MSASVEHDLTLHEFNKEELKEAGVIIDYIDEGLPTSEDPGARGIKKKWEFNPYIRWVLLGFLMLAVLLIIGIGLIRIESVSPREMENFVQGCRFF